MHAKAPVFTLKFQTTNAGKSCSRNVSLFAVQINSVFKLSNLLIFYRGTQKNPETYPCGSSLFVGGIYPLVNDV